MSGDSGDKGKHGYESKTLGDAVDRLADRLTYGALIAATNPIGFIDMAADELMIRQARIESMRCCGNCKHVDCYTDHAESCSHCLNKGKPTEAWHSCDQWEARDGI